MTPPAPPPARAARLLTVALLCGVVVAVSVRPEPPPPPFRLGAQAWVGYAPAYLARRQGDWPESVVSVVELPTDAAIVRAMRSDGLEAACLTLDGAFRVQAAGVDVRVIAVLDYSTGADAVVAAPRAAVTSPADLRGKRVGVERHGVGMLFLARALRSAGLTVRDVSVVNADITEYERLVAEGRVDAVVTYSPQKERLVAAGGRVVCDSSAQTTPVIDVLVVRADVFGTNPAAVRALARGWWAAADRLAARHEARTAVARAMGISPGELAEGYRQVRIPTRAESLALIGPTAPRLAAAAETATAMAELGVIDGPVDPARLFVTPAEVDLIR